VRAASTFFWHISVNHKERLRPRNSIIVANHQSILDPPLIMNQIPYAMRKSIFLIAKKELSWMRIPFAGAPVLFVDRTGNIVPSLKAAADVLRSGHSLLIFPEGTRTRDGSVGKFRSGAAYLAKNLNKKIIPVTIKGAFKIMPSGKHIPSFSSAHKVRISIGSPIDPLDFQSVEALNDHLHKVVSDNV
jgi:1-acyl-sn-glycerol-3-phosphate acyltransferase